MLRWIPWLILVVMCLAGPAVRADDTKPPAPKTIFDYKTELGLSDTQVDKIKTELSTLGKAIADGQVKLQQLEGAYAKFLESEPSIEQAKAKLQEIAGAQVDLRLLDLQTSRRVMAILSSDQIKKWRDIQIQARTAAPSPSPSPGK